jgi:hypothetical protein
VVLGRLAGVDAAYELTEISHPAGTIWLAGPIGREARVVIKVTERCWLDERHLKKLIRDSTRGWFQKKKGCR